MINDKHPLLLDNLKTQFNAEMHHNSSIRVIEGTGNLGSKRPGFDYNAAVGQFSSWVYAAVMLNANAVASAPLRLYVRHRKADRLFSARSVPRQRRLYLQGLMGATYDIQPSRIVREKITQFGEDFEEVTDRHPVLELLNSVNPWYNGFDLLQLIAIYLETTGNAYIHPVLNGPGGVPSELWPMPSQWVFVIPDQQEFIRGYAYGRGAEQMSEFAVDEVIHFRHSNPSDEGMFYGKGKIEAAWDVIALNQSIHNMDNAMADNRARPDYMLVLKSGTNKEQLDRFEAAVERKLKGNSKAGRFISFGGDVELHPLNFSPKDLTGRDEIVEEIAAVAGVPVSLLKANDPNLASAQTGFAAWKNNTILPLLRLIEQKLNEQLLPLYGIENDAVLAFDNPVPEDRQFDLTEASSRAAAGLWTINEAREKNGDPPIDGGDVARINGVPLEQIGQPNPALQPFTLRQEEDSDNQPTVSEASHQTMSDRLNEMALRIEGLNESLEKLTSTESTKAENPLRLLPQKPKVVMQSEVIWKTDADDNTAREDQPDAPENRLANAISDVLEEYEERVLEAVGKTATGKARKKIVHKSIGDALKELESLSSDLQEAMKLALDDMLGAGMASGLERIGVTSGFDVTNPNVVAFLENHRIQLSGQIARGTSGKISQIIIDAMENGLGIDDMQQNIVDSGVLGPKRARVIARTESANAYVEGEMQSWRDSGVVIGKEWLLAPNACEFCESLAKEFNKKKMNLDQSYASINSSITGTQGGTMKVNLRDVKGPPLHPNCRCDLIPITEPLDEE